MAKAENIKGLDCGASALDGIKLVLGTRLREMCALRKDALNWADIEGVHDMRVASRRLRSALRDFSPYFHKRISQKRLKRIADALGAVRDDDVAIAALDELAAGAKKEVAEGIKQFAAEHRGRRERERAQLKNAIGEVALGELRKKFVARLEQATNVSNGKKANAYETRAASATFRQIGRDIISARFTELDDLSESLCRPFETEPLHRMRIAAKRLRYSIELFASCWGAQITPFAEEIAELQKSLGELHDCDVWIADLGARLGQHHDGNVAINGESATASQAPERRSAAVWLIKHFVKERTKHFRDALTRWHKWETTDFSTRLTAILNSVQPTLQPQPSTLSVTAAAAASNS